MQFYLSYEEITISSSREILETKILGHDWVMTLTDIKVNNPVTRNGIL